MPNTKHRTVRAFTKSVDEATREVEQIVSVFDNLDLGRDTVKPGAFAKSLDRWAASGDPIPAIWSHDWDNPFAHIGHCIEAKELLAGDPLLPAEIADLGGLYTRYKVDTAEDNPFAGQVFNLLKGRRVREASFAYDVIQEKRNPDGTTDLIELDVIEIGPTLKGMNPMTQLLAVKARRANAIAELVKAGLSEDVANAALDAAEAKTGTPHTFIPQEAEPDRCSWPGCGLTRNTTPHLNTLSTEADGAKAVVQLSGSLEVTADAYYSAAFDYVNSNDMADGGLFDLAAEGTFPDDARAVYRVEGWADPYGGGYYCEFNFEEVEGTLQVASYTVVTIEAQAIPAKNRKRRPASAAASAKGVTVTADGTTRDGKTEDRPGGKVEDPAESKSNGEVERTKLEADLLELS